MEEENQVPRELLEQPAYYAVIPSYILSHKDLSPNSKLLYAQITALTKKEGYCYATNAFLGECLGISKITITDLLRQLKEANLIEVQIDRVQSGTYRQIRLCVDGPVPLSRIAPSSVPTTQVPLFGRPKIYINKESKNNNIMGAPVSSPPSPQKVFEAYQKYIQPKAKYTPAAKDKIKARLKSYSQEDLLDAITKFKEDTWRMENNAHLGPAWFFSSDSRIDQFLNLASRPKEIVSRY